MIKTKKENVSNFVTEFLNLRENSSENSILYIIHMENYYCNLYCQI